MPELNIRELKRTRRNVDIWSELRHVLPKYTYKMAHLGGVMLSRRHFRLERFGDGTGSTYHAPSAPDNSISSLDCAGMTHRIAEVRREPINVAVTSPNPGIAFSA